MRPLDEIKTHPELRIIQIGVDGGIAAIHMGQLKGSVIWSIGGGWEHVSVAPVKSWRIPTWEEMCMIKNIFFMPEEVVVQYHPAESEYVNLKENCLHLWRPTKETMPTPPFWMVGPKTGGKDERPD